MRFVPERHRLYRILIFSGIAAAILIFLFFLYNESPMKKGKTILYIPSSTIDDVSTSLEKNGYELNTWDRFALHFVTLPKEGWYRLDGNIVGRFFFLKNLHKKNAHTISIKIFAGETTDELLKRLSRDMILSQAKLNEFYREISRFEEGGIIADRYTVAKAANEETVIRFLLDKSNQKIEDFIKKEFGEEQNLSEKFLDTLIIASIIQRESNDIEEMPKISSVIHNRLKQNMRLQMDGTLNYGKYTRTVVTPERIKSDTSRYNTYKHKGLPPGPLGSVSMDALNAAANPEKTKYLYFVLNKEGKHDFVGSYQKHLENVKSFKKYLRESKEVSQTEADKTPPKEENTAKSNTDLNQTKQTQVQNSKPSQIQKEPKKSDSPSKETEKNNSITLPAQTARQEESKSSVAALFDNLETNNTLQTQEGK